MRTAVKVIAWVYLLTGAAAGSRYLYALFFGGPRDDFGGAVLCLLLGAGLLQHSPLARGVALLLSAFGLVAGLAGLALCVGHVTGTWPASGGLIVEQPAGAFALLGLALAYLVGRRGC